MPTQKLAASRTHVEFYVDLPSGEISVDEVPALVYSETMRDVDLFSPPVARGRPATVLESD